MKDLSPWLEYFEMLRKFCDKGLLEVRVEEGDAFITQAALAVLGVTNDTVVRIRAYADWLHAAETEKPEGTKTFALHIVEDAEPHDLCYTIVITRCRRWFSPWRVSDKYTVINYKKE